MSNEWEEFEPIIILSGKRKSLMASPSIKNSGFEITVNFFLFLIFFPKILSILLSSKDFLLWFDLITDLKLLN